MGFSLHYQKKDSMCFFDFIEYKTDLLQNIKDI